MLITMIRTQCVAYTTHLFKNTILKWSIPLKCAETVFYSNTIMSKEYISLQCQLIDISSRMVIGCCVDVTSDLHKYLLSVVLEKFCFFRDRYFHGHFVIVE